MITPDESFYFFILRYSDMLVILYTLEFFIDKLCFAEMILSLQPNNDMKYAHAEHNCTIISTYCFYILLLYRWTGKEVWSYS